MNVVVVESPAKARTINKYLGRDFHVLASYGHVRDLPSKDGSVRPDADFEMDWEVDSQSDKRLKDIVKAVKQADALYLATDPDREGEAISWHILEELRRRRALSGVTVRRVAFNAITKDAIKEAFEHPRELNQELIEAYLARRALDYLVGFNLSPVLWRKLPGSKSAGRVQSVALRLVCEREAEIEAFRPQEYWTIQAQLRTPENAPFAARLTHLDGKRLEKFDLPNQQAADAAKEKLEQAAQFRVASVERKQTRRNPQPPFTTSTLQQEASRKLGFGASRTMRVAQRLYEGVEIGGESVGLITYMRTDGVQISNEALEATRDLIGRRYGSDYLPGKPRAYATRAKNAQEAHEAIRPTDLFRTPDEVGQYLDNDGRRLYDLVWKRTVASQMESARLDQVTAEVAVDYDLAKLRATGSTVVFDGFYKLYREGRDDAADGEDDERRLPQLKENQDVSREKVEADQHFTQPPPRYSEASLVKRLEELGIGRPSTYATILQVLQDRDYVRLEKRRFLPEDRGRLVTAFLTSFFDRYVEYDFTAKLEEQLDDISGGRANWKQVLRDFWEQFHKGVESTRGLKMADVISALDEELGPHFFPVDPDNPDPDNPDKDPRACPQCGGRLGLKIGRTGGFIGCGSYPECTYTRPLVAPTPGEAPPEGDTGPRELGTEPETGDSVVLKKGPFGPYIQLGEGDKKNKPKRVSLPKGLDPTAVDLQTALALLSLPREICKHPEDGEPVQAGIGRYGPYIKHGRAYVSLPDDDDVLTVGQNRALTILAESPKKRRARQQTEIGEHPREGGAITASVGRYGPYVKHDRTFASLPKGTEPESVTLQQAVDLLDEQAKKKGNGKTKSAATGKTTKAKSTKGKTAAASASSGKTGTSAGTKAAGKSGAAAKGGKKTAANASSDSGS